MILKNTAFSKMLFGLLFWIGYSFLLNDKAARVSMTIDTAATITMSRARGNSGPSGGVAFLRSTCLKASMP